MKNLKQTLKNAVVYTGLISVLTFGAYKCDSRDIIYTPKDTEDAQVLVDSGNAFRDTSLDAVIDLDGPLNCPPMPYSCSDNPTNNCCKRIGCTGVLITEDQCHYPNDGDASYLQDACKNCDNTDTFDAGY